MAQYYTLGASLPTLKIDDHKGNEYDAVTFVKELLQQASKSDTKQINLILLPADNAVLLAALKEDPIPVIDGPMAVGVEKIQALVKLLKEKELDAVDPFDSQEVVRRKDYPAYMIRFAREFLTDKATERPPEFFYVDILQAMYYEHVQREGNTFLRTWTALDRNITLVLAAITVKRFDLDARKLIIGESELVKQLRTGNWGDVSYLEEGEVVKAITQISEEKNLSLRERKIDDFKWDFLDSLTFADTFSINAMMAYYLKLTIIDRWSKLDKTQGEKTFRAIVEELNKEGKDDLEAFKEIAKSKKSRFRQ